MSVPVLGALGLAILGAYALAMSRVADRCPRSRQWWHLAAFAAGLVATLVGFVPSPALFGADHRFTTNMGQLLVIWEVAAPLLLVGLRAVVIGTPGPRWSTLGKRLAAPLLAGLASTAVLIAWHLPAIFAKASGNLAVWSFKEALLLGVGLMAWAPVASPVTEWRAPYAVQLIYLFLWRTPMMMLGAIITFAGGLLYTGRSVGLEICAPASLGDQQAAGLLMIAVGGTIVLGTISVIFFRWFAASQAIPEDADEDSPARISPGGEAAGS